MSMQSVRLNFRQQPGATDVHVAAIAFAAIVKREAVLRQNKINFAATKLLLAFVATLVFGVCGFASFAAA